MITIDYKVCPRCKEEKLLCDFHKSTQRKSSGYCKKCSLDYSRNYIFKNKEKFLVYKKNYFIRHRNRFNELSKIYRDKKREDILDAYGRICICCGELDYNVLELDHVNNDGKYDRVKNGTRVYEYVIKQNFPKDKYQLLCACCNRVKSRNSGEMPLWRRNLHGPTEIPSEQEVFMW